MQSRSMAQFLAQRPAFRQRLEVASQFFFPSILALYFVDFLMQLVAGSSGGRIVWSPGFASPLDRARSRFHQTVVRGNP
jgi:hypothetical protein